MKKKLFGLLTLTLFLLSASACGSTQTRSPLPPASAARFRRRLQGAGSRTEKSPDRLFFLVRQYPRGCGRNTEADGRGSVRAFAKNAVYERVRHPAERRQARAAKQHAPGVGQRSQCARRLRCRLSGLSELVERHADAPVHFPRNTAVVRQDDRSVLHQRGQRFFQNN